MGSVDRDLYYVGLLVENEITKYIPKKGEPQELFKACWNFLKSGGKKFRPTLVYLTCEAFGGHPFDSIPACASIELDHNWLLIHDDIEDDSKIRRGKPCLHITYGIPQGINIGDYLRVYAEKCMLGGKEIWGEEKTLKLLDLRAEMLRETSEGQALELYLRDNQPLHETTLEMSEKVLAKKTGFYTAATPCAYGMVIADRKNQEIAKLMEAAKKIGIAFQIIDDVLNVEMMPEEEKIAPTTVGGGYGKDFFGDAEEGKRTILLAHAYSNADNNEKKRLEELIGNKDISFDEKIKIKSIYEKCGSIEFGRNYAKNLLNSSITEFESIVLNTEGKKRLLSLLNRYIVRYF